MCKHEEVSICAECGEGVVEQHFAGDEGWGICGECESVEGRTEEGMCCYSCGELFTGEPYSNTHCTRECYNDGKTDYEYDNWKDEQHD